MLCDFGDTRRGGGRDLLRLEHPRDAALDDVKRVVDHALLYDVRARLELALDEGVEQQLLLLLADLVEE